MSECVMWSQSGRADRVTDLRTDPCLDDVLTVRADVLLMVLRRRCSRHTPEDQSWDILTHPQSRGHTHLWWRLRSRY